MTNRDDFLVPVRNELRRRAGNCCSHCRAPTEGPGDEGTVSIGVAAHITAAASGGARYDAKLTAVERSSAANGIWLCQTCSRWVDRDEQRFTVDVLVRMRTERERQAAAELGRRPLNMAAAMHASLDALAIHEIRRLGFEEQGAALPDTPSILSGLSPYADTSRYSSTVTSEYMQVLSAAADRLRGSILARGEESLREHVQRAARAITEAATRAIPVGSSSEVLAVIEIACEVGGALAYDGCLYTRDLRVVDAGAEILWFVLRGQRRGRNPEVKQLADEQFDAAVAAARRSNWDSAHHAEAWLRWRQVDALSREVVPIPEEAWAALDAARA